MKKDGWRVLDAAAELARISARLDALMVGVPVHAWKAQPALLAALGSLDSAQGELDRIVGAEARSGVSHGE